MNRNPDVELVLRDYFADDGWTAPDHVLDVIEERIMRQPQQRPWRVLGRDSHVNSYLKPLLAVAAVVVIAVAGIAYLGQPSDSGVGGAVSPAPSPMPVASASPSTAPSAGALFPEWFTAESGSNGAGILPSGSATTRAFVPGSTFSVPAGWVNDSDHDQIYGLFPNTSANEDEYALAGQLAQDMLLAKTVANNMFTICEATGLFQGATATDVIDWAVANEAFSTSEPVDVTIGGLNGRQVDIQLDPAWTGSCPLQENDPPTTDYGDARARIIMLEVPGGGPIGIHIGSKYSADFEAFLADAMPILESFQFNLGPEASPS